MGFKLTLLIFLGKQYSVTITSQLDYSGSFWCQVVQPPNVEQEFNHLLSAFRSVLINIKLKLGYTNFIDLANSVNRHPQVKWRIVSVPQVKCEVQSNAVNIFKHQQLQSKLV